MGNVSEQATQAPGEKPKQMRSRRVKAVFSLASVVVAGVIGTMTFQVTSGAAAADGPFHYLIAKMPAQYSGILIISGTRDDGSQASFDCVPVPDHGDGEQVSTGLKFQDGTYLSIAPAWNCSDQGRQPAPPQTWRGTVPSGDGLTNLWVDLT